MVSQRQRILDVFRGKKPETLPFASRLDFWLRHHQRRGSLPDEYQGMDVLELSRTIGIGREDYVPVIAGKYHHLEIRAFFENESLCSMQDPVLVSFPNIWEIVPKDRAGTTCIEFITPVGSITSVLGMLQEAIEAGASSPIIRKHAVQNEADYRVCEYILEHVEWIDLFDSYKEVDQKIGEDGYPIPMLGRIPFQSCLIDILGEETLFYAINDSPNLVCRLIDVLDEGVMRKIELLKSLPVPFVEFGDNLDGWMTNPRLFKKFALPYYQKYSDLLHNQEKKMGSHTDGDLKSLLYLLPESGIDFCESFTPAPMTQLSFDEAWMTWKGKPKMWGGLPSMMLEDRTSEDEFKEFVRKLVDYGQEIPYILGVCDAVMGDNLMERVRYIVEYLRLKSSPERNLS